MTTRKRLTDILLSGTDRDRLQKAWSESKVAEDFKPLPSGEYTARITRGELETSRSRGTPGYKLEFTIVEGEYAGRKVWHDCWLTEAAMPQTKRDLARIGVTSLDQLENPLPPGMLCRVKVALRTEDDGAEHNRVKAFVVVRIEPIEPDAFAPPTSPTTGPMPGDSASSAAAPAEGGAA